MTSTFPIEIRYDGKLHSFTVKPVKEDNDVRYEIWKEGSLYFKLESVTDKKSPLKISPQFNSAGINTLLTEQVAAAIKDEEAYETYD